MCCTHFCHATKRIVPQSELRHLLYYFKMNVSCPCCPTQRIERGKMRTYEYRNGCQTNIVQLVNEMRSTNKI